MRMFQIPLPFHVLDFLDLIDDINENIIKPMRDDIGLGNLSDSDFEYFKAVADFTSFLLNRALKFYFCGFIKERRALRFKYYS